MDDGYFEIAQTEVSASDGGYKPRERTSPPSRVKARPQAAVRVQKKRWGYRFVKRALYLFFGHDDFAAIVAFLDFGCLR